MRQSGAKKKKKKKKPKTTPLQFLRPPWRAARLYLLRWLRIFFLSQSRVNSFALAPFKKGGGGPDYYYYYYYYYYSFCLKIRG